MGNRFWDIAVTVIGGVGSGWGYIYEVLGNNIEIVYSIEGILYFIGFLTMTSIGATLSYFVKRFWDKIFNKNKK